MEEVKILNSIRPSFVAVKAYRFLFIVIGPFLRALLKRKYTQVIVEGEEHLQNGPVLVLMNHADEDDPLVVQAFGRIPMQFLISESFMRSSLRAKIVSLLGHVAKRKLDFDPRSIQLLKKWSQKGASVAVFPEGVFNLYGEPGKILKGLDALILLLDLPVVCARLSQGVQAKPKWAQKQRKTNIKLTFFEPIRFKSGDAVLEFIQSKIFDQSGNRLEQVGYCEETSVGLASELEYCPSCAHQDSLYEDKKVLSCRACQSRWQILEDNKVIHTKDQSVKELFLKSFDHKKNHFRQEAKLKTKGPVTLFDIKGKNWKKLEHSPLEMDLEHFIIGHTKITWMELVDLVEDWGKVIILKTKSSRFALELSQNESKAQWFQLLNSMRES